MTKDCMKRVKIHFQYVVRHRGSSAAVGVNIVVSKILLDEYGIDIEEMLERGSNKPLEKGGSPFLWVKDDNVFDDERKKL